MKLMIDIPNWYYEETLEFKHPTLIDKALINGIPVSAEGEYIKKDDVIKVLQKYAVDEQDGSEEWRSRVNDYLCSVYQAVSELSTYSFPDREKGEWLIREDNTSFVKQIPRRWVECSCCGWSFSYDRIRDDYCSKCGADMRGKADENNN